MRINGKTPREILGISSVKEFLNWLPCTFPQVMILSAFVLTALAPLLVSIVELYHFDPVCFVPGDVNKYALVPFFVFDFHLIMSGIVFPYVWFAAILAYLINCFKSRADGSLTLVRQRKDPTFVLMIGFIIWMLVNVFIINGPTQYAIHSMVPNEEGMHMYLEYWFCFFLMGLLLTNRKWKSGLMFFFALTSILIVPFAVYYHLTVYTEDAIRGVFYNSNYYGIYLSVFVSLLLSMAVTEPDRKRRAFYTAALLINTAILYFNNTLGAWVGIFFACLFSIIAFRVRDGRFNRRSIFAFVLYLGVLVVCGFIDSAFISGKNNVVQNLVSLVKDILQIKADPNSTVAAHAGSGRWALWKYYMGLILEHPWFGIGLEGVSARDLGHEINKMRAHNEYLHYATFFGIPGLALYFSACLSVFIRAIRHRRHLDNLTLAALTAAFGYLVGAFFGNTCYNTTPYLYIMLGLGYVNNTLPLEGSNG